MASDFSVAGQSLSKRTIFFYGSNSTPVANFLNSPLGESNFGLVVGGPTQRPNHSTGRGASRDLKEGEAPRKNLDP
jgi:hypothetical protein